MCLIWKRVCTHVIYIPDNCQIRYRNVDAHHIAPHKLFHVLRHPVDLGGQLTNPSFALCSDCNLCLLMVLCNLIQIKNGSNTILKI